MGLIASLARTALRRYASDGVPASGNNNPSKTELLAAHVETDAQIAALQSSFAADRLVVKTVAALPSGPVPANGTAAEVWSDPGGDNTNYNGLWLVVGGAWEWQRPLDLPLTQAQRDAGRFSIFLDPYFKVVRRRDYLHDGRRTFGVNNVTTPNGEWDADFVHDLGVGAWKVTGNDTYAGWSSWFDAPEVSDLNLEAGDVVSAAIAAVVPSTKQITIVMGFMTDYTGTLSGTSFSATVTGDGTLQIFSLDNKTIPANAKGVLFYTKNVSASADYHVAAHWVMKGARAGGIPPERSLAQLVNDHAKKAKPLALLPNADWIRESRELLNRATPVLENGAAAVRRPFANDICGIAVPFIWSGDIDAFRVPLTVETTGVTLLLKVCGGATPDTVIAEARCEALKNVGFFEFRLPDTLTKSAVSLGYVATNVLYLRVEVEGGACELQGFGPMGFPKTGVENVNYSTYPQLTMSTGSVEENLSDWDVVSGDDTLPFAWQALKFGDTDIIEQVAPSPDQPVIGPYFTMFGDRETNIYLDNVRSGLEPRKFSVSSGTNVVKIQDERVVASAGAVNYYGTTITVNALDEHGHAIASATARTDLSVSGLGNDALKVLIIGDSHNASARCTQRMLDMSAAYSTSLQVTLLGTKTGDSGVSVSSPFPFLATINGVANSGNKHEATGGWGLFGNGDDDGSYYSTHANNPFRNGTGPKKFDFANYLSTNTIDDPDVVVPWVFSNDVFNYNDGVTSVLITTDAICHLSMDQSIDHLDRIIGLTADSDVVSIQDTVPDAKIVIVMPAAVSMSQDGYAKAYAGGGTGMTFKRYKRNNIIARWRLREHYDTSAMKAAGIYLFDAGPVMDPVNGFPDTSNWSTSNSDYAPKANQNTLRVKQRIIDPIHPYTITSASLTNAFQTTNGSPTVTVYHTAHGKKASSGPDKSRVRFPTGSPTVGGLAMAGTWDILSVATDSYTFTHSSNASSSAGPTGSATPYYLDPGGFEQMGEALWIFLECAIRSEWFTRSGAGP